MKQLLRYLVSGTFVAAALISTQVFAQNGNGNGDADESPTGYNTSWRAYPQTAETKADAKLLLTRKVPTAVRPQDTYTYEVHLKNRSNYQIDSVSLTENVPDNFRITGVIPEPDKQDNDKLRWNLGIMAPGQEETMRITGTPTGAGEVRHAGNADVGFQFDRMDVVTAIVAPELQFTVQAPEKRILGDGIPLTLRFQNVGNADVIDASMKHTLSDGLTTGAGESEISLDLGTIEPEETKVREIELRAEDTDTYSETFTAQANENISESKTFKVEVVKPALNLSASAPDMRYVGNKITYTLDVSNNGTGVAKDVRAELDVPANTTFQSANEGGEFENGKVKWQLTSLGTGNSRELRAEVMADKIMTAQASARVNAHAAQVKTATMTTNVKGIRALLMNLSDVNDPVLVGKTETYTIQVQNQGSLPAEGVKLRCILQRPMELDTTSGPTEGEMKDGELVFEPLDTLAPGKTAQWKVKVKALDKSDVRFKAVVTSKYTEEPVERNESTTFYE